MSTVLCGAAIVCLTTSVSFAADVKQSYSQWKYDAPTKRYTCHYEYTPPQQPPKKQVIVYYPEKPDYIYYYNAEKQSYWGRCASPYHKGYNQSQMQWSYYKDNKWSDLSNSCPKVPQVPDGPEIAPPPVPPAPPGI